MTKPARSIDEMPEVLSIVDLAEVLRCSTKTIERRLAAKDNLPPQLFLSVEAAVTYARQDRALRAGGMR